MKLLSKNKTADKTANITADITANKVANNYGFTLVEMLAVATILAVIIALAVPNVIKPVGNARKGATDAGKAQLEALLNQYYLEEDKYPETLQELVQKGFTREIPKSGDGQSYVYHKISDNQYSLQKP